MRAKIFFEHVCPTLFRMRESICQRLGGRYAFHIGGSGDWTLDFEALQVEADASQGADLELWMETYEFEALIAGKLDPLVALNDGALKVIGDRRLFANLATFTAPTRKEN